MSVSLRRVFTPNRYEHAKVRSALDAITAEIPEVGSIERALGSVTLPSGARRTWQEPLPDFLFHLSGGTRPSIEVFWSSSTSKLHVHWLWDIALCCTFDGDDEEILSRAITIFIRECGVSPIDLGLGIESQHVGSALAEAIRSLDEVLWCRYVQACRDVADPSRLSYHAPMHDLRDILAGVLRTLAPDQLVTSQPWYVQEKNTHGPTQTQRARYILTVLRGRGSDAVATASAGIDHADTIATMARSTYSRASAAHAKASRDEASQIQRYVEAVLGDLLGVEGR